MKKRGIILVLVAMVFLAGCTETSATDSPTITPTPAPIAPTPEPLQDTSLVEPTPSPALEIPQPLPVVPVPTPDPTPVVPTPTYVPEPAPSQSCCKVCSKSKACGDSCISRSYTCHQPPGCACDG